MTPDFHKVGLLVVRDGRMLLCRKRRGTGSLILPGGCVEAGESHRDCLTREIREELDTGVAWAEFIDAFESPAADAGKTVRIELYRGELSGEPRASSEIAELVWFGREDDPSALAPSLRDLIVPDAIRRNYF